MISYSIYVVDDEVVARNGLSLALEKKNFRVKAFESAETALEAIEKKQPDLVLLDIGLPGISGVEALKEIKKRFPDIIVIMITAFEDVKTVVSAMKYGAYEYVVKPVQMEALLVMLRNAFDTIAMRKEIQNLHENFLRENLPCFIGESNVIQDVMKVVKKVAQSPDTSILVQGETGTGKELIARAIHSNSNRKNEPFISINCSAIPENLLESELFGHIKGAFTGAFRNHPGLISTADGGTLFLDEVGEIPQALQAKLLRFLQDGSCRRVGDTQLIQYDVRILSATNRNLEEAVKDGLFREDLFFRLNVIPIYVPPLRERKEDIPLLANEQLQNLMPEMMSMVMPHCLKEMLPYMEAAKKEDFVATLNKILKEENVTRKKRSNLNGTRRIF